MRILFFSSLTLFLFKSSATETVERSLPNPRQYCYDEAGVLASSFKKQLESSLEKHEKRYDKRMAVFLLQSLEGEDISSFASRFIKTLNGEMDNPTAILIVSVSDRKVRVALNPKGQRVWPPEGSQKVIAASVPFLKEGEYRRGILHALDQMASHFGVQTMGEEWLQKKQHGRSSWVIMAVAVSLNDSFWPGEKNKRVLVLLQRGRPGLPSPQGLIGGSGEYQKEMGFFLYGDREGPSAGQLPHFSGYCSHGFKAK